MRILVIDDNSDSLHSLCLVLQDLGHEPKAMLDSRAAIAEARSGVYPLIISDIRMPHISGLEILEQLKGGSDPVDSDVLLITGYADVESAVRALRSGASDYLHKPVDVAELSRVVEKTEKKRRERAQAAGSSGQAGQARQGKIPVEPAQRRQILSVGEVVAGSELMRALMDEAMIFHANPSAPVLLEGETGTGKEILARLIHYGYGNEVDTPFVALNCSAIPHELFGSELFGHEAGAFTGSRSEGAPGKLELAGEGTLFLDEIAEMPYDMQPKLLRVLEDRSFYRLGGKKLCRFKARVICAGNRDLSFMVEEGLFRRDLYHRLSVGHLIIPPLRERQAEIADLALFFLRREAKAKKKIFSALHPEALDMLRTHPWLGNVRELRNVIERAVILHNDEILRPEHLQLGKTGGRGLKAEADPRPGAAPAQAGPNALPKPDALPELALGAYALPEEALDLEALYDEIIFKAVEKFGGNKSKAAEYLKISRFALHRRLRKEAPPEK